MYDGSQEGLIPKTRFRRGLLKVRPTVLSTSSRMLTAFPLNLGCVSRIE